MREYKTHKIVREAVTPRQCQLLVDRILRGVDGLYEDVEPNGLTVRQDILDLDDTVEWGWLYAKMWKMVHYVNNTLWQFDIETWQQPLRLARYTVGHKHDWHTDHTPTDASKLAFSVPLNLAYEGGVFELLGVTEPIRLLMRDAVVFPAYHGHRVTEVTAGQRYVLLGWVTGPRFV